MNGIRDYLRAAEMDGDEEAIEYYEEAILDHEEAEGDRRREEGDDYDTRDK